MAHEYEDEGSDYSEEAAADDDYEEQTATAQRLNDIEEHVR